MAKRKVKVQPQTMSAERLEEISMRPFFTITDTGRELIAEVRRLRAEVAAKDATREADGAKWSELAKNSPLSQAKKSK